MHTSVVLGSFRYTTFTLSLNLTHVNSNMQACLALKQRQMTLLRLCPQALSMTSPPLLRACDTPGPHTHVLDT